MGLFHSRKKNIVIQTTDTKCGYKTLPFKWGNLFIDEIKRGVPMQLAPSFLIKKGLWNPLKFALVSSSSAPIFPNRFTTTTIIVDSQVTLQDMYAEG